MVVTDLGLTDYVTTCQAMQAFTVDRTAETQDELWLLEHYPVFSQGSNGDDNHILLPSDIPIVQSDRGGQVTYHGPGQLIAYTLFDLRRLGIGVREMVSRLERTVIALLALYDVQANADPDAPGVYINGAKIASLGLRVKRGACYHGISLNVDMDLTPFSLINPCGYKGMAMTDLKTFDSSVSMTTVKQQFISCLSEQMKG